MWGRRGEGREGGRLRVWNWKDLCCQNFPALPPSRCIQQECLLAQEIRSVGWGGTVDLLFRLREKKKQRSTIDKATQEGGGEDGFGISAEFLSTREAPMPRRARTARRSLEGAPREEKLAFHMGAKLLTAQIFNRVIGS